ncbi:hypothetical protein F01_490132 [Burkholderia cenocepacia]|nr:hypothetical protein F01_490132 [Burkholderia cenocepacia]
MQRMSQRLYRRATGLRRVDPRVYA